MKKFIALFLVLVFAVALFGCAQSAVLKETVVYPVSSKIHSLEVRVGAAEFMIKPSESFSVESNLKYLSVSEKDGVLSVIDKKTKGVTYDNPVLIICMPVDQKFERIDITTGAGRLSADALLAKSLELTLGAGDARITTVYAENHADIIGGAGEITILGGMLNNLDLEMGVGELNLTASLLGNCDLTFGVGESNITLIGDREDYEIEAEKGVGSVTVDGKSLKEFESIGTAQNYVQIQGGVGSINLNFQGTENA